MPELPEVEICRRNLERWAAGRRLDEVIVRDAGAIRGTLSTKPSDALPDGAAALERLVGTTASAPVRHGKRLGWAFGDRGLLIHLGMTGSWRRAEEPPDQARLGLRFGGTRLWFRDPRRFGCVVPCPAAEIDAALVDGHGPDALRAMPTAQALQARFRTKKPIKVALMDQDRIAGIGNIHAAEALWRAKIAPDRPAQALGPEDWAALATVIPAELADAIAEEDAEDFTYLSDGGPNPFAVYDREGAPCPRCGGAIAREVHAGRATFWCPRCQPA